MASAPALDPKCVLARTSEGTRQMSARSQELAPKLRSVLFLVSGRVSFGELLDRAGSLRNLLESQIRSLLELGLIEIAGKSPAPPGAAPQPGSAPNSGMLPDLPPVAGAKIQLLRRLESSGSFEASLLAEELLEARTLRELAERARTITLRLQEVDGRTVAEAFWVQAKDILIKWRDLSNANR
jgi:hypothetical protein